MKRDIEHPIGHDYRFEAQTTAYSVTPGGIPMTVEVWPDGDIGDIWIGKESIAASAECFAAWMLAEIRAEIEEQDRRLS